MTLIKFAENDVRDISCFPPDIQEQIVDSLAWLFARFGEDQQWCSCPPDTPARLLYDKPFCNACNRRVQTP